MTAERYGESLTKAERARALLLDAIKAGEKPSLRAIAREVGTSHSQVSRIKDELDDDGLTAPSEDPRWRPDLTAWERLVEERDVLRRHRDQLLADAAALVAENRRLREAA